jgi:hypothetical protein
MATKQTNIPELATALEEYASLENSELGEYLHVLIDLSRHGQTAMGRVFRDALVAEMELQLDYLKSNCRIEEEELVNRTTVKVLKFSGE